MISDLELKIVKLDGMRMLSFYGFGTEPEQIAWEKLKAFSQAKGLHPKGEFPSNYGFNNPDPSKKFPEYGYEIWMPVDEGVKPEDDVRIVQFYGGLYAVTTFKGLENIGEVWGKLYTWQKDSGYRYGSHQWVEELTSGPDLSPEEYVINLYLSILE